MSELFNKRVKNFQPQILIYVIYIDGMYGCYSVCHVTKWKKDDLN